MPPLNVFHVLVPIFLATLLCSLISWKYLVYPYTGTSDVRSPVSAEKEIHTWTDITDIFVPSGQKYNEEENIIYNCFATGPFKTVEAPKKASNLSMVTLPEEASEDSISRRKSFQKIFEEQIWQSKKGGDITSKDFMASGTGSSLEAAQAPLTLLNSLIDRLKIYYKKDVISIVDIPCGDFVWMRELVSRRPDVQYTGIDIVPALIEKHKKEYGTLRNAQFVNVDIVESSLNQSYDIIFSRDMLQHLYYADVMKVLAHFSTSGSNLLVATNMLSEKNTELNTHNRRYRHLNLMLAPISLVPPVCSMRDDLDNKIKELSVWKLPLKQRN